MLYLKCEILCIKKKRKIKENVTYNYLHYFQAVIKQKHENVIELCVFIGYINASYKISLKRQRHLVLYRNV